MEADRVAMFMERPSRMTDNDWLALRVVAVKEAMNGASNAMKITPFYVANTKDDLLAHLDLFAQDIEGGAAALIRLTKIDDVTFDREASGRDAIADMLLAAPDEIKVREVFDRARGGVWHALEALKSAAKESATLPMPEARTAMMRVNTLHNVVRGAQDFYRRVPATATEGFIFR